MGHLMYDRQRALRDPMSSGRSVNRREDVANRLQDVRGQRVVVRRGVGLIRHGLYVSQCSAQLADAFWPRAGKAHPVVLWAPSAIRLETDHCKQHLMTVGM